MKAITIILRGIGQVSFQNNAGSGVLFLLGIFYSSYLLGLATLIGAIISTSVAAALKAPKDDIENGLYGFNGALAGIAVLYFFELSIVSALALLLSAALSAYIMSLFKKDTPALTAPFVSATWLTILILVFVFNVELSVPPAAPANSFSLLQASIHSFGQVMFQESMVAGACILLAVFINNRLMAAYAAYAAVLSSLIGQLFLDPIFDINSGLIGYNAILCAIALTGTKPSDFAWITLAVILSTVLNSALATAGLIPLTAAFILVTWLVLHLKKAQRPLIGQNCPD